MRAFDRGSRARVLVAIVVLASAWTSASGAASAQLGGRAVIEPGREEEVVQLFAPHALGGEVVAGWRLAGISIREDHIVASLEGPEGTAATVRLDHPDVVRSEVRSLSFAITTDPAEGPAGAALAALTAAVQRNDQRSFWRTRESSSFGRVGGATRTLALDGIVLGLFALGLLLALVASQLRGAPRWALPALLGIVLGGGALRVALSPVAALGVWPYTRVLRFGAMIFEGPVLAWLTEALSASVYLTELLFTTNLIVATLTPLAAYAHAHYVLRDARAALACAALFALFPNHIRFSSSEVEFILSLALSSATLAFLHGALSERSRPLHVLSSVVLPIALYASIVTRELNIILVPLLIAAALMLRGDAPRARLAIVLGGIAIGAVLGVGHLMTFYPDQVREGLSVRTVVSAVGAFFSLHHNTLINPRVTPPGITALAVLGAVWMWRSGERRHAAFLLGWFGAYFVAHSYVLPGELAMQARYHLHLAPPVLLLAAAAIVALWDRRRRVAWVAIAYVAVAPLLHADFIRDTAFNDVREFAFLRSARERLPEGCTVLEFQGAFDYDVRFVRMGAILESGERRQRWTVLPAGAVPGSGGGDPLRAGIRDLVADPPECLAYYESLNCWAMKERDEPIAPACAALRELAPLEVLARTRFESRPYDENLARGFGPGLEALTLTLYRVRPRARADAPPTGDR
ncbi:MAG: hypothetical protein M3Y87_27540 [Myxococcota bacterium]|nr:hypothetical protein [Myxococcota bacterium]